MAMNDIDSEFKQLQNSIKQGKSPVTSDAKLAKQKQLKASKSKKRSTISKKKSHKDTKSTHKPTNVKKIHHRAKKLQHKIRSHKPANNFTFGVKHKRHKIQYGNLRVNIDIVRQLKLLQQALGLRSRSALLKQMVQYCKPAILSDSNVKSQYKIYKKSMKTNLEAKKMNK